MNTNQFVNTTVQFYPKNNPALRLIALWYFLTLMIVWNFLGHLFLGFEQPWAAPFVGVGTAMIMQVVLDWLDAKVNQRQPRYVGGVANFINLLVPGIIPGFACAMLLYPNERMWPIAFAAALSIASKIFFRAPVAGGRTQHFFNPSNFGIAATLLLFPEVGFAPPYHFTTNLTGGWHWFLPVFILLTGVIIHGFFTGRLPLVAAWLIGFALQGQIRAQLYGFPPAVPLMPMTSAAFIVFTLYMIPDPATTPIHKWRQVLFGFSVAMVYGWIQMMHWVFGLFFALIAVCAVRGLSLHLYHAFKSRNAARTIPATGSAPA